MAGDAVGHALRGHAARWGLVLSGPCQPPHYPILHCCGVRADVRLAQQPGSFPHKAFVSLVTRANGICYNLSSGRLQGRCGHVELGVGMGWVCSHYWGVAEVVSGST